MTDTKMLKEMPKRIPVNGTFELTGRCNLNCKMCYVHVDEKRIHQLGYRERTASEWISMGKQVLEAGTFKLLLTGGEPMIRQDFCEIYEAIAKMGFFITLYTNATLVTPKIMDVLQRFPPHTLGITIYGLSPNTYGSVCGHPDAYQKMISGLKMLMTLPSKIELRTTIIKDNLNEAEKIEEFIKGLGDKITFNVNHTVFQSGRNSIADIASCRLSPQQNAMFYITRYQKLMDEYLKTPDKLTELRLDQEKRKLKQQHQQDKRKKFSSYQCNAGYQEYTISWDGRLLPCSLSDNCYTEPFKDGFKNAWENLGLIIPEPILPKQCLSCKVQQFCGACFASRYCETGNINGIPRYFCQVAEAYNKIFKERRISNENNNL